LTGIFCQIRKFAPPLEIGVWVDYRNPSEKDLLIGTAPLMVIVGRQRLSE